MVNVQQEHRCTVLICVGISRPNRSSSRKKEKKIDFPLHIENTIVAEDQQRHGVGHTGTGQQRRACLSVI